MSFLGGFWSDSIKRNSANIQRIQPLVHFYLSWNNKKPGEINHHHHDNLESHSLESFVCEEGSQGQAANHCLLMHFAILPILLITPQEKLKWSIKCHIRINWKGPIFLVFLCLPLHIGIYFSEYFCKESPLAGNKLSVLISAEQEWWTWYVVISKYGYRCIFWIYLYISIS